MDKRLLPDLNKTHTSHVVFRLGNFDFIIRITAPQTSEAL